MDRELPREYVRRQWYKRIAAGAALVVVVIGSVWAVHRLLTSSVRAKELKTFRVERGSLEASILDLLQQTSTDAGQSDLLETCSSRCRQMSRFVTRMADVVRIPKPTRQTVNVQDFLLSLDRFLETLCSGFYIKLKLDLSPTPVEAMMCSLFSSNPLPVAAKQVSRGRETMFIIGDS